MTDGVTRVKGIAWILKHHLQRCELLRRPVVYRYVADILALVPNLTARRRLQTH